MKLSLMLERTKLNLRSCLLRSMTELEKEKMDSVRALAETNMQISEAKTLLFKMREEEKAYIASRSNKALTEIQKIFDESSELVQGIRSNYKEVNDVTKEASILTTSLLEARENLTILIKDFEEHSKHWEKQVKEREKVFEDIKKDIKKDQVTIANDKKSIEKQKTLLKEEQRKIEDQRATLERAIERLKQGRI